MTPIFKMCVHLYTHAGVCTQIRLHTPACMHVCTHIHTCPRRSRESLESLEPRAPFLTGNLRQTLSLGLTAHLLIGEGQGGAVDSDQV